MKGEETLSSNKGSHGPDSPAGKGSRGGQIQEWNVLDDADYSYLDDLTNDEIFKGSIDL